MSPSKLCRILCAPSLLLAAIGVTTPVLAQAAMKAQNNSGDAGRDVAFALPLALYGESVARFELNLDQRASLSFELNIKRRRDDVREAEAETTQESLLTDAKGGILMISRYSEPNRLAGFYWTLGAGFRTMNADWQVQPDPRDKYADLSLTSLAENTDVSVFHHRATLAGTTGHLRAGYRYVAQELPLMIGGYIGIRHFQASVKDAKLEGNEGADQGWFYAPMTERERERLRRRYMTQLEPAIELGFVF